MEKRNKIGEVSFVGDMVSEKLWARKTWQFLFDYYRAHGGPVNRMDNMLCDYMALVRFFDNNRLVDIGETSKFTWSFRQWVTTFYPTSPMYGEDWYLEGEYSPDRRLVEFTLVEVPDGSDD